MIAMRMAWAASFFSIDSRAVARLLSIWERIVLRVSSLMSPA